MALPADTHLSALFSYISRRTHGSVPNGNGLRFRDLYDHYLLMLMRPAAAGQHGEVLNVQSKVREALEACGLDVGDSQPSTLSWPGQEKRRAAAAAVLAAAIVKVNSFAELKALYSMLMAAGRMRALAELKNLLTCGDEQWRCSHPTLTLKNFTSAGWQKDAYVAMTYEAYDRAAAVLDSVDEGFIRLNDGGCSSGVTLAPRVQQAFEQYFGRPDAMVGANLLGWAANAPSGNPCISHLEVVRHVLRRVVEMFRSEEPVWLYMGGKSFVFDMSVCSSHSRCPTRIHLDDRFFEQASAGASSRASALIHEMTHAWACTTDHGYSDADCSNMARLSPGQALTNAQSYVFFLEKAFC